MLLFQLLDGDAFADGRHAVLGFGVQTHGFGHAGLLRFEVFGGLLQRGGQGFHVLRCLGIFLIALAGEEGGDADGDHQQQQADGSDGIQL